MQKLYIKNMVCQRCILAIESELNKIGITPVSIQLGEVTLKEELPLAHLNTFSNNIQQLGFELLDDQKQKLIERIKNIVIEKIHHHQFDEKLKFSEVLAQSLHKDYSYLSNLFSEVEGITIEKYIIEQRIEKVKELLIYDELSLSEIAYKTGYSSIAHLSSQFKKVTGLTPSNFKKMGIKSRRHLDKLRN